MHARRWLLTLGVTSLTLGTALVAAPARAAGESWASTATRGIQPVGATALGALAPTTALRLAVALAPRNVSGLDTLADAVNNPRSSSYGDFITPSGFLSSYAPTTTEVDAVTAYLRSEGFTDIAVQSNQMYVTGDATAAQAEAAFDTTLTSFLSRGSVVYANTTPAMVPAALEGTVTAVLGLSNDTTMQLASMDTTTPPVSCVSSTPLCTYTPQGFQTAYDAGKTATGSKTAVAIMAEGDLTQVLLDLRQEETTFGLPKVPVTVVKVGPGSTDTSGADEWDLDTQYSTGIAQTVKHLYIYDTTSLTDSDVALEFNQFAAQDVAPVANASFGECEYSAYLDGFMLANDEVMAEAAAQGQTLDASTGDQGSGCPLAPTNGVPASGPPDVAYPASSPYVVAVGGTSLLTNANGSYDEELAWNAGGGGISLFENAPEWQDGVSPAAVVGEEGLGAGRTLPDIAMSADANISAADVDVDGTFEGVGGTSLAAPLATGVWARLQSAHNNTLGFASPVLYSLYPKSTIPPTSQLVSPYPFHDITLGSNGAYAATPGYDLCTGLGSYDISLVSAALTKAHTG